MTTRTVCSVIALTLLATHVASAQEYPEGWELIKSLRRQSLETGQIRQKKTLI